MEKNYVLIILSLFDLWGRNGGTAELHIYRISSKDHLPDHLQCAVTYGPEGLSEKQIRFHRSVTYHL